MSSEIELDVIIDLINRSKRIGIFTHMSPDGDAIGSSLGLFIGLKQLKKEVEVICDEYSRCFEFLPFREEICEKGSGNYDLVIALDCASRERLFDPGNFYDKGLVRISIDHHASNTYFADYNYVEGNSPAVCKTLVKILRRLNIFINKEIGQCLMAGIITDSGGFRYRTVDDETFEFAANMLDVGVDISDIYYRTFDVKTKPQFQLFTLATSRLKFYSHDRIAITYITEADFKKVHAMVGDHEGIVNVGRNIEGVEVSVFLREVEKDFYRVSLRSNSYVDVSVVAKVFGGGGHSRAAGCDIRLSMDAAIKRIVREVVKEL